MVWVRGFGWWYSDGFGRGRGWFFWNGIDGARGGEAGVWIMGDMEFCLRGCGGYNEWVCLG